MGALVTELVKVIQGKANPSVFPGPIKEEFVREEEREEEWGTYSDMVLTVVMLRVCKTPSQDRIGIGHWSPLWGFRARGRRRWQRRLLIGE